LQITGPYRLVRHPIYLGWLLATFGPAHLTLDRLMFAAISAVYLVVAMPIEERALRRSFGEAYARYQERVRWRVVPYIY
jgi:protein-S-isoprenylcysteine O-methyltransferase Ste14